MILYKVAPAFEKIESVKKNIHMDYERIILCHNMQIRSNDGKVDQQSLQLDDKRLQLHKIKADFHITIMLNHTASI